MNISRSQVLCNMQHYNTTPPAFRRRLWFPHLQWHNYLNFDSLQLASFNLTRTSICLLIGLVCMSLLQQLTSTSSAQNSFWWFECAINATDCPMTADQGNYECLHGKSEDSSLKIILSAFQVKDVWLEILKFKMYFSISLTYKIWASWRALIYLEAVLDYLQIPVWKTCFWMVLEFC